LKFDNDKLVQITDDEVGMDKSRFDSQFKKLIASTVRWKAQGCKAVIENDDQMFYLYKDSRSYMSV
jgi:hypothetical protein